MTDISLIEQKELREQMIERIDVLDKVKKLFLIPKFEVMTTRQVAEYYEVAIEAIQKTYQRHKEEIDFDGVSLKTHTCLHGHFVQIDKRCGIRVFDIGNGQLLEISNNGATCFSKRAILRIGMLLRDSEIAKEVRTQLLNVSEKATVRQLTQDIDEEMKLMAAYGYAATRGTKEDVMEAAENIARFQNRHISELKENIEDLETAKKILVAEILTWDNRSSLNRAVRCMAWESGISFQTMWNKLYSELLYKWHINQKNRGKAPYLQYIKQEEWTLVQQSLAALCEQCGIDICKILQKAKLTSGLE